MTASPRRAAGARACKTPEVVRPGAHWVLYAVRAHSMAKIVREAGERGSMRRYGCEYLRICMKELRYKA